MVKTMAKHNLRKKRMTKTPTADSGRLVQRTTPPIDVALHAILTPWYNKNKRNLPWRNNADPYAILVSELMLQQTQVVTVIPYFNRFLKQFPTVQALAKSDLQEVLRLWAGLGYYSLMRTIPSTIRPQQQIVQLHHGVFPTTASELQKLPGVGRYTAGAIASIAFQQRVAVLDGNVMRVLARLTNLHHDISLPQTQRQLWDTAEALVPADSPGDHNQSLMELGATVCLPQNPAMRGVPSTQNLPGIRSWNSKHCSDKRCED